MERIILSLQAFSASIILCEDWNLLQIIGSNADHYYVYLWYTMA